MKIECVFYVECEPELHFIFECQGIRVRVRENIFKEAKVWLEQALNIKTK